MATGKHRASTGYLPEAVTRFVGRAAELAPPPHLAGAPNFRDLGGFATVDDRRVARAGGLDRPRLASLRDALLESTSG